MGIKAQELATAIWRAEADLRIAAASLSGVMRLALEAEAELDISPTVTSGVHRHLAAATAGELGVREELARAHKLAGHLAKVYGVFLDTGPGGRKGQGSDDEPWNPFAGLFGAADGAEPALPAPTGH